MLQKPKHPDGYTKAQIDEMFDDYKRKMFYKFMDGQTIGIIDGEKVYYTCDVYRFIRSYLGASWLG